MAGFDDIKAKLSGMPDNMKDRLEELRIKEQDGELDDKGREELSQLRARFMNREN